VIFKEALGVALRVRELKETKISSSSLLINAHAHAAHIPRQTHM
jgi:hypothetical protein